MSDTSFHNDENDTRGIPEDDAKVTDTTAPAVTSQEGALVGDEAIAEAAVNDPSPQVNSGTVPAQVVQPREGDSDTVQVHETSVKLDTVITDPSSPLAVQIPDAGRGDLSLPIHRLDAPTVEEVFAKEASKADDDKS